MRLKKFDVQKRYNSGVVLQDICALMEVVSSVSRCGGGAGVGGGAGWTGLCARGLRALLPLVTPALLALPALAHRAYRMLRDLDQADQVRLILALFVCKHTRFYESNFEYSKNKYF